ncbi:agmatinase [Pimelobacter simplex]|nr:agmatinase [Pimelobacter simplex]
MSRTSAFLAPHGSFLSLPAPDDPPDGPEIAIVGIGFDVGTHPSRIGARGGPGHIRQQSRLLRPHLADRGPLDLGGIVDWGDVRLTPGRLDSLLDDATPALAEVVASGAVPVVLGGDGTATFPVLRALAAAHGPLAVVHFDAHTDAYPDAPPGADAGAEPLTTATTFTRAVDEGLVDPARSIHLGVRGTTFQTEVCAHARRLGYAVRTTDELVALAPAELTDLLVTHTAGRPVHLSWDMDVFDPAAAPGVATPEWGGLSAREGLAFLRALEPLDIVGADVATVSPPHDLGGTTGLLAARVVLEIVHTLRAGRGARRA